MLALGTSLVVSCATSSSGVEGSYPTHAPRGAARGAAMGAVAGTTITGIATNGSIPLGAAAGAMLGAPIGSYNDYKGAVKQLASLGITVVELGDVVEIVIPADIVFDPGGNEIQRSAEPIMNQIVMLLKQYGDVNMSVIGHSDNVGTDHDQAYRSNLQAQSIMSYIWSHGISSERLSYYGVGAQQPAASFKYANGQSYNRHIDLVFWRKGKPGQFSNLFSWQNSDCWMQADQDKCNTN